MRTKADYALLWANGASFGEVYDLMKADIETEQARYLRTQGTKVDFEIIEVDGVDGTDEYMHWAVYTKVEERADVADAG